MPELAQESSVSYQNKTEEEEEEEENITVLASPFTTGNTTLGCLPTPAHSNQSAPPARVV